MKVINEEIQQKLGRLRALLEEKNLDAIVLRRTASVAWITGGAATWVNTANGEGPVTAVITAEEQFILTNTIEGPRLIQEERLPDQGWTVHEDPWYSAARTVRDLLGDTRQTSAIRASAIRVGSDVLSDQPGVEWVLLGARLSRMRAELLPVEQERAALLGADCALALGEAAELTRPGQSEYEIAAHIWERTQARGVQAIVSLVATDDRIWRFRHPLATGKKLERYAMLVLCGRRAGLVSSMTRLIHFGPVPEEVRQRHHAVATIDARMIGKSRAGVTTGEIFQCARDEYGRAGFPTAWEEHHQGGVIAYEPREYLALPEGTDTLQTGMTCTWNPSLEGAKSEDTILLPAGDDAPRVLTAIPGWPLIEPFPGAIPRPDILVR